MGKQIKNFDPTVLLGLLIALLCIMGGLILEKGEVRDVAKVTAGLIVLGGTFGAVVVSTPMASLRSALRRFPSVFWSNLPDPTALLEAMVVLSHEGRRAGTNGLDDSLQKIGNPFLRKAISLVVDAYEPEEIRTLLETETLMLEQKANEDARVFETAGGYAPTIGIIGAVLGLMQVMKHLDNIQEVGRGIAVAFVATVYGVGLANLVLLPIASKIRAQCRQTSKIYEMIVEGALIIQQGKNPRLIRMVLEPYLSSKQAVAAGQNAMGPNPAKAPIELRERAAASYR
jgi:chemotaxis protein MotA